MAKVKSRTKVRDRRYDSAEYLDTPEAIADYLTDALEDGDPSFIAKAIGTAARARGMSEVAREASVSRENLYRALSGDTKPEFDTIRRVIDALGVRLEVKPKAA